MADRRRRQWEDEDEDELFDEAGHRGNSMTDRRIDGVGGRVGGRSAAGAGRGVPAKRGYGTVHSDDDHDDDDYEDDEHNEEEEVLIEDLEEVFLKSRLYVNDSSEISDEDVADLR
jgi:hypothetical protein